MQQPPPKKPKTKEESQSAKKPKTKKASQPTKKSNTKAPTKSQRKGQAQSTTKALIVCASTVTVPTISYLFFSVLGRVGVGKSSVSTPFFTCKPT